MSLHSITCEDISPLLDAYHDGELDKAERDNVAGHLTSCPSCQSKLVEIESVVSSLKNLPRLQITHDLTADPEYLKRAMEVVQASESGRATEKVGAEIKEFPVRKQSSAFAKSIFPLPGPVIFASVAAAAALALVVVVPRYLNSTNSTTVAIAPKQVSPKLAVNPHSQTAVAPEISNGPDLKVAHNPTVTPDLSQDSVSHQPVHNIAQVNDANAPAIKDPQAQTPPEIASATLPTNNEPESAMVSPSVDAANPPAVQAISQGDQTADEIPASATTTAEPAELLALYPGETTAVTDELAIPTDEDGLYALKL
jgi:anti-sigma factor RsiW